MTKNGKTKYLMIQGTGSHVGKSVITAAFCRILSDKGYRVAPFKAQNMALNSMVTGDGCEVGRSTALQALAARAELRVEMNPVLIKPKAEKTAQVILKGKPYGDFTARESFSKNRALRELKTDLIRDSLDKLAKEFEWIVIEGAGSPAEVNLREFDVVNMDVALYTGAPVLIVGDIEPGGLIASLVGTHLLLEPGERERVKGFLVNKFRGDKELLTPALETVRKMTGWEPLGVIPFHPAVDLMEEDRLPDLYHENHPVEIDIAVIRHRHLANFTDLDPLKLEPGLRFRYISSPAEFGKPDALIIPGSKNTVSDLKDHWGSGLARMLIEYARGEGPILGICAGYQMLGTELIDPDRIESPIGSIPGLGLLNFKTIFQPGKITQNREVFPDWESGFIEIKKNASLFGYEIHSGRALPSAGTSRPLFRGPGRGEGEGMISKSGLIAGTHLHGILDNDAFRRGWTDFLRKRKGLPDLKTPVRSFSGALEESIKNWAVFVENHLDPSFSQFLD